KRILVVDDYKDVADSLGILLEIMGHEVRVAYSGQEALEALARFEPDVALLDLGLPGMNGYQLARRIREQPRFRNLTPAAQTGWGQEQDRRRSEEAGFNYHQLKPVAWDEIEKILRELPAT